MKAKAHSRSEKNATSCLYEENKYGKKVVKLELGM